MTAPFYNAVKSGTSGTPGTGAFTPNATAIGNYYKWSDVAVGIYLVRFVDGTAEELAYSYWNGTTLSRGANQIVKTTTGSLLTLTSAATASMVADANEVQTHVGGPYWVGAFASINTTVNNFRGGTVTETGTATGLTLATSGMSRETPTRQLASATTVNAQCGWSSPAAWAVINTTAGRGGFEYAGRCGFISMPTGPRLFAGVTAATFVGQTIEPSAFVQQGAYFGKDSTDSNIQLMTNDGSGSATKIDTGIALASGGVYEFTISMPPGGGKVTALLCRMDTGEVFYKETSTDIPATTATLLAMMVAGLNGTNTGTACTMHPTSMIVRGAN